MLLTFPLRFQANNPRNADRPQPPPKAEGIFSTFPLHPSAKVQEDDGAPSSSRKRDIFTRFAGRTLLPKPDHAMVAQQEVTTGNPSESPKESAEERLSPDDLRKQKSAERTRLSRMRNAQDLKKLEKQYEEAGGDPGALNKELRKKYAKKPFPPELEPGGDRNRVYQQRSREKRLEYIKRMEAFILQNQQKTKEQSQPTNERTPSPESPALLQTNDSLKAVESDVPRITRESSAEPLLDSSELFLGGINEPSSGEWWNLPQSSQSAWPNPFQPASSENPELPALSPQTPMMGKFDPFLGAYGPDEVLKPFKWKSPDQ
jgi:hypothetical protein